jgi:hypothetical protein
MSLLLGASVLFSSLLAVSPALHQFFHNDANQASHECVVTMLQKHQVSTDSTLVMAVLLAPAIFFFRLVAGAPVLAQTTYSRSRGRAPPAILR